MNFWPPSMLMYNAHIGFDLTSQDIIVEYMPYFFKSNPMPSVNSFDLEAVVMAPFFATEPSPEK